MDRRLSELRRRFVSTNALEDEVKYLHEALRAGELEPWEIEVAVYLGSQAASILRPASSIALEISAFIAHGELNSTDAGDLWAVNLGYEYPKDALIVSILVGFHWVLENTAIGLNRALYDYYDSLVKSFLAGEISVVVPTSTHYSGDPPAGIRPEHFSGVGEVINIWVITPGNEDIIGIARTEFRGQMEYILESEVPWDEPDPRLGNLRRLDYANHIADQLIQYVLGYKTAAEILIR